MSCPCKTPIVPNSPQQLRSLALANKVVTPTCPVGYHWDDIQQKCIKDIIIIDPPPPDTWDCDGNGNCNKRTDGLGVYTSLAACQAVCVKPCAPVPILVIDPPDNSNVVFPVYVFITCTNRSDVNIYYTIDDSIPDNTKTLYTGPFQLTSNPPHIKAVAYILNRSDCPSSPVYSAAYTGIATLLFDYICSSTDRAGAFADPSAGFAPNSQADFNFRVKFTTTGAFTIKRIELYNTINANGIWTTGQAWSTNSPISPPEGPSSFPVFPLVLTMDQAAWATVNVAYSEANQPFTAYAASLGALNIGDHFWKLFAQPFVSNTGYFKLRIIKSDDTVYQSTIKADCCNYPVSNDHSNDNFDLCMQNYTDGLFSQQDVLDGGTVWCTGFPAFNGIIKWLGTSNNGNSSNWGYNNFQSGATNYFSINGNKNVYGLTCFFDTNLPNIWRFSISLMDCSDMSGDYTHGWSNKAGWAGIKDCGSGPKGKYLIDTASLIGTGIVLPLSITII